MSFFARLFKNNEPETLEQKIAKVEQLPQEQLLDTALNATEVEALRVTAISKLSFCSQLLQLAIGDGHSKQIVNNARKRIGELLDSDALSLEQLSKEVSDQSALISLCGYSSKTGASVVDKISNEPLLLNIAQTGDTTQIRQAAAGKISQRESLNLLVKAAKNKDKSVLKIAKKKLDVFKEKDAEEAAIDAKVDGACKQAEQLAKRDIDDIFHARKKQIEGSWIQLASLAKNEATERFNSAIARCQQKIDDLLNIEHERATQEAADKEAKQDVHSALHATQELISRMYIHDSPHELEEDLVKLTQRQESALIEAKERGLNTSQEHHRGEDLSNAARSLLGKLRENGPIAELVESLKEVKDESGKAISHQIESMLVYAKTLSDVPTPDAVSQAKNAVAQWRKELRQTTDKSKEKIKETAELIRKADWAVSKGYVGKARAIFKDLEGKIQQLDQIPNHIETKFDDVKESMKKLGDWHEFAVTPKKEILVEKMQALVDSTLHPQDLANKIHQLQDNWKELCKGGQNQDEDLWEKFHGASQIAYERCKTYFDEQTILRETNAELRLTLIAQLEQYEKEYDWEKANWKDAENTLKVARETWQSYWPVPRKQIKELQQRFDGILDRIFALRNDEFETNKSKKQNIVDQASTLAESSDIQAAIDAAKNLQVQWQTIGRCKRKDDQQLWKAFRVNCDAIFVKRDQENEVLNEERKEAKIQADEIILQLQAILDSNSSDFFAAKSQCTLLNEKFQSIGELPKNNIKSINTRYHKLLDSIEQRVDVERKTSSNQQWQEIFRVVDQIRSYELKCIHKEDCAKLKTEIEAALDGTKKWPSNTILSTLQNRIEIADHLDASTVRASDELLRILCIRSEILTDNETPEDEKAYRMTYQVNQLKDAFGQANSSSQNARVELINEWLNTPAASNERYPSLLKRFSKCWDLPIE